MNSVIPIRRQARDKTALVAPVWTQELYCDPENQTEGLPWLHGNLITAAVERLDIVLQIHNRSGIPIVEGRCLIQPGQRTFTFNDIHALGIEAYAHARSEQRLEVAQRVWSRRAYATLRLEVLPDSTS